MRSATPQSRVGCEPVSVADRWEARWQEVRTQPLYPLCSPEPRFLPFWIVIVILGVLFLGTLICFCVWMRKRKRKQSRKWDFLEGVLWIRSSGLGLWAVGCSCVHRMSFLGGVGICVCTVEGWQSVAGRSPILVPAFCGRCSLTFKEQVGLPSLIEKVCQEWLFHFVLWEENRTNTTLF